MHQRVGQFWKLVIEFLAQAPRKKRKAFQQPLYIRILTGLCEKGSECRITLGEPPPELSQPVRCRRPDIRSGRASSTFG